MNELKLMDSIIGQVQNDLTTVYQLMKKNSKIATEDNSKIIDLSISNITKVRDEIYKIDGDFKPDTAKKITAEIDRYRELLDITNQAFQSEENQQLDTARKNFERLLSLSHYSHFKEIAEAGLYRVEKEISGSK